MKAQIVEAAEISRTSGCEPVELKELGGYFVTCDENKIPEEVARQRLSEDLPSDIFLFIRV